MKPSLILNRALVLLLPALLLAPVTLAEDAGAGTATELKAVPDFLEHLFVPLIPEASNSFDVTSQPVEEILFVPDGYTIERKGTGLSIHAPAGEKSGYARIRLGGRELTLTLVNLIPSTNLRGGFLEGYHIGNYVLAPLRGLETYRPPKGFIRLTPGVSVSGISHLKTLDTRYLTPDTLPGISHARFVARRRFGQHLQKRSKRNPGFAAMFPKTCSRRRFQHSLLK
jgi:hypothetical protein